MPPRAGECSDRVCDQVSCANGGICFPNHADGYICLCPLGFRGALCEERESMTFSSLSALQLLGCWQMTKNAMRSYIFIVHFVPSLQVSQCPHLSSMRQCFPTPLSHGLRAICPLWSLRWRSVHRYQMGCCFTAMTKAAGISWLSILWTDM